MILHDESDVNTGSMDVVLTWLRANVVGRGGLLLLLLLPLLLLLLLPLLLLLLLLLRLLFFNWTLCERAQHLAGDCRDVHSL